MMKRNSTERVIINFVRHGHEARESKTKIAFQFRERINSNTESKSGTALKEHSVSVGKQYQ
jgi:hypothetical protein